MISTKWRTYFWEILFTWNRRNGNNADLCGAIQSRCILKGSFKVGHLKKHGGQWKHTQIGKASFQITVWSFNKSNNIKHIQTDFYGLDLIQLYIHAVTETTFILYNYFSLFMTQTGIIQKDTLTFTKVLDECGEQIWLIASIKYQNKRNKVQKAYFECGSPWIYFIQEILFNTVSFWCSGSSNCPVSLISIQHNNYNEAFTWLKNLDFQYLRFFNESCWKVLFFHFNPVKLNIFPSPH